MKRNLFLLSTAALALTPAIVANAEYTPSEWTTIYESPYVDTTRTIASTRSAQYTANSAQDIANAFLAGLSDYNDVITINYTDSLNYQQMADQLNAVWYNLHDLNDYLSGTVSNIKWNWVSSGNTKTVTIQMGYHSNYAQQQYITQQVQQIIAKIIKPGMSDFDKVKAVTDYIVLNHSYNSNTKGNPHSVYTFVTEKQGVCQAYALLAQRIFDEIGIASHYVTGFAREGHAWNLVQVDGEWYHLDVTWADPFFSSYDDSNKNYISYGYFLMSDAQIAKDHTVDADQKNLPKATSTRFTAYHSITNPVQIGNELFFPNSDDNIRLYKINMNDRIPTATKVSDTRFQHLFYANGAIYFSNYSNSAYLSKLDLNTMNISLVKSEKVTHIIRQGQNMVAYNGSKVVYSEAIVDDGLPSTNPTIQTIISKIDQLNPLSASFLEDYIAIGELIETLSEAEADQITNAQKFIDLTTIAEQYIEQIEQIETAINRLSKDIQLPTLKDLAGQARALVNKANPAVARYLDLTQLEEIEKYILEQEKPIDIEQAETLLQDLKFLSKDFITRAEQLKQLLDTLGNEAERIMPKSLYEQALHVKQQYEKMKSLSFQNSSPFSQAKTTTNALKPWTIALTQELANTQANRNKIKVVDMFGDPVAVTISINGKNIIVTPSQNYEPEIPYTLVIEAGLESANGKTLSRGQHLQFTFKK